MIPLSEGEIKNKAVRDILLRDGSQISDWTKCTTTSVKLRSGESRQIHFYRNTKTGRIDYETMDFKVKDTVSLDKGLK